MSNQNLRIHKKTSIEIVVPDAKRFFNESASTTYKDGGGDFFLGYVGVSDKGRIGIETVSVSEYEFFD